MNNRTSLTGAAHARSAALRDRARRSARICLWAAAALCAPLPELAHAQTAAAPVARHEIGDSANAWLALQRNNAQAAPAQPMLGAEAGRAYRRYLKSFDTPIPASLGSTVGSSGGGGSGQMGAGGAMAGGTN